MTIDILMATYNGGKYIREQLDSIMAQTNQDWRLLVRDDGSSDDTVKILEEYRRKADAQFGEGKIVLVPKQAAAEAAAKDKPKNRNVYVIRNFSALMEHSKADGKADYIMFSDQDDKWHPDKVEKTLAAMKKLEAGHVGQDIPLMVHTDSRLVRGNGSDIGISNIHARRLKPESMTFKNDLVQCATQGCTIMMNRKLLDIATPIPDEARMHDMWVGLIASGLGKKGYIAEPTMDYRQHESNVLAGTSRKSLATIADRLQHVMDAFFLQARALDGRIGDQLEGDRKKELDRFIELEGHSQPGRGIKLIREGYLRTPVEQNIAMFGGSKWFGRGGESNGR